jgi:hypothetical protein
MSDRMKLGTALILVSLSMASLPAVSQQTGDIGTVEQNEIGRLRVRTEAFSQALAVVSELARASQGQAVDCNGICYFLNNTKAIAWTCSPKNVCNLYCTVDPPVGGCDSPIPGNR